MEGEAGALIEPLLLLVAARAPEGLSVLLEVLLPPPLVSEDSEVAVGAPPVAESVGVCETVELTESGGEAVGAAAVADTEAEPGTLALALLPSTRLAEPVRLLDAVSAALVEAWPDALACWALPLRDTDCVAERAGERVCAAVNVAPMERWELPLDSTVADSPAEGVRREEGEASSTVGEPEADTEPAGDRDGLELNVGIGLGLALAVVVVRPSVALGVCVGQPVALELLDAPCVREDVRVSVALLLAIALLVTDTEGEAEEDPQGVELTDGVKIALNVGTGVGLVLAVRVERPSVALGVSVGQLVALELLEAPCVRESVGVLVALPLAIALLVADTDGGAEGVAQGVAEVLVLGEVLTVAAASKLGEA